MKYFVLFSFFFFLSKTDILSQIISAGFPAPAANLTGYDAVIDSSNNIFVMTNEYVKIKLAKIDSNHQIQWSILSNYSGSASSHDGGIFALSTGEFVAYLTRDFDGGGHIIKFDGMGNILWDKRIQPSGTSATITNVIELQNLNLLVAANDGFDLKTTCLDPSGNQIWTKIFDVSTYGTNYVTGPVVQTYDGGIVLTSTFATWTGTSWVGKIYLCKLDAAGTVLWEKIYDVPNESESIVSVIQASDNFIYTVGSKNSDFVVRKFDENGNWISGRQYGGNYTDSGWDIKETDDGNFLVIGEFRPDVNCVPFLTSIYKIEPDLDTIWTKVLGNPVDGGCVLHHLHVSDTLVYSFGHSSIWTSQTNRDAVLIKTNNNFEIACGIFRFTLNVSDPGTLVSEPVMVTISNSSINFDSNGVWTNSPLWLNDGCTGALIDSLSYLEIIEQGNQDASLCQTSILPNFSTQILTILLCHPDLRANLTVYDLSGKLVYSSDMIGSMDLGLSNVTSGIYILNIRSEQKSETFKVFVH